MKESFEIKCRKYLVTLTDKKSGEIVSVSLSEDNEKWVVNGDKYYGVFNSLESAWKSACEHLFYKEKGMKDEVQS
tara:strand:- start:790 stop:1014 length:225 start_codon:yes stop_codon:yes gene_type:complete